MTFGQTISATRRQIGLSQKELATRVRKEDGSSISPQYLNDLERDRRGPPSDHLIQQFAKALDIAPELLYFAAGRLPSELTRGTAQDRRILAAFKAFRKALTGS